MGLVEPVDLSANRFSIAQENETQTLFLFFFAAKNEVGLPFSSFVFPLLGRKQNSNSLHTLHFSFLQLFHFLFSYGIWKTSYKLIFVFRFSLLANGSETDIHLKIATNYEATDPR